MSIVQKSRNGNRKAHLQCRLNTANNGDEELIDMVAWLEREERIGQSEIIRMALKSLYQQLATEGSELQDLTAGRITKEMAVVLSNIQNIQNKVMKLFESGEIINDHRQAEINSVKDSIFEVERVLRGTERYGTISGRDMVDDGDDWE